MKFAAIIEYLGDKETIGRVRPEHRKYLASLLAKGQLAASGPFTDDSGALIIYEASSPDEAKKLLEGDPFSQAGVFVRYQLRPWNPVLANRDAFPGAG